MHVRQGVADVEKVTALGNGLRKIICASRPSTGHGALAVAVATRLSALPSISRDTFYDITGTVGCCVRNTPKGTTTSFKLPDLLTHLERHVANAAGGSGSGRRRLLQTEDAKEPNNLRADLNCWSGKMVTATVTSSQSEGYTETLMDGQFTVAVVANQVQLPVVEVNGVRQNGMEAGSADEGIVFYAKGACAGDLFSEKGDQKRFLAVQAMSNFVTEDGFQSSPPPGGFLSDALFLTQVYKEDAFGNIEAVEIAERQDSDPCFCHKLPIKHKLDELNEQLGSAPSMFSLTDKKPYKVDPTASDEYFNYVVDEAETLAYNIKRDGSHSWVEERAERQRRWREPVRQGRRRDCRHGPRRPHLCRRRRRRLVGCRDQVSGVRRSRPRRPRGARAVRRAGHIRPGDHLWPQQGWRGGGEG
jgi:hypothetical protein